MTLEQRLRELAPRAPGVVVAIVDAGGVRESAAIGLADIARAAPASTTTPWHWFSMTKVFTATAAMRLSARGELDLDAPVRELVPDVARLVPEAWATRITPRHLLSHRAGIANPLPLRWIRRATDPAPDVEVLAARRLGENRRLRFEPGTRAKYTNLGMLVMGAAMQRAAKTPFASIIAREVTGPLGMSRTGFDLPEGAAVGYHARFSPLRFVIPQWVVGPSFGRWVSTRPFLVDGMPYGGLVGPIDDLARFLRLHLGDDPVVVAMRERGLGWFRHLKVRRGDPPSLEHGGGGPGFFDVMRVYPTLGVAVAVLGNATKYDIDAIARLALA
jgi:CubicO group peptidase (beta-lactamase class C family)